MPTLLDFSGLTAPEQAQGESLRPLLVVGGRESWKRSPAFSEKPATTHFGTPAPRDTESTAILFEGWKLIHNSRRAAGAPEFELYHRRDDPLDQNDVAAQNPDVVARLREHLAAWQKLVLAQRLEADDDAAQGLSSEEMERLRALGYL
jgi:arylsulfatase A-like enzyme